MTLRISRLLSPVTVLGPGRRVGIWVQGCTLACPGCASADTWDTRGGRSVSVEACAQELIDMLNADISLSGLSITGGEPVQQGASIARLVELVRSAHPETDVLLFTGYALTAARREAAILLDHVDAVVAGPYRRGSGFGGPLVGSANQQLHILTPLGESRFASYDDDRPAMQVAAADGELLMVGIPRPGDLDRLEIMLAQRGITFGEVTWRS